ncbi:MAG: hypothetical protein IPG53_15200 [Ignavibacteriales bacterium]|nr:hypothetical protein [Ignavibacteriales bacterium]
MKKLLFLFVLINGYSFSQMKPGIDYLPQIAFFDFVVNYLSNPNWTVNPEDIKKSHDDQNWYFDKLKELGLTNLVSDVNIIVILCNTLLIIFTSMIWDLLGNMI